jgi:hypothetical protein
MKKVITPIVARALAETVLNVGQLSHTETLELKRAVRHGVLVKGRGGPYPNLKTVFAAPGYDFAAEREKEIAFSMLLHTLHQMGQYDVCLSLLKDQREKPYVAFHDFR